MKRRIRWEHAAVEDLFGIAVRDDKLARRLMIAVRTFGSGQRVDIKKLGGSDFWRRRAGDWRILLSLTGTEATIESIDNRREAY